MELELVEDLIKKVIIVTTIQLKLILLHQKDIDLIIFMLFIKKIIIQINALLDKYKHINDKIITIVNGFNSKFR